MKYPLLKYVTMFAAALVATLFLTSQPTNSEFDVSGLNDQVQNHEGRIGSLEDRADVTETQVNQNTADLDAVRQSTGAPAAAPVPRVQTERSTAPAPQPAPEPQGPSVVMVTKRIEPLLGGGKRYFCDYLMSDGQLIAKLVAQTSSPSVDVDSDCPVKP